tara:strand:+ start:47 stop:820 length:774 start_codon:yes stop_codon:yes gene_type:complete
MGGEARKKNFSSEEANNNSVLKFPLTVTTTTTSDILSTSGVINIQPELTWATPASGVLSILSGNSVNVAYKASPYDLNSRKATLTFTTTDATKVFVSDGNSIAYNIPGVEIVKALNSTQENLIFTITLPPQLANITATSTITDCVADAAAMGTIAATHPFAASGNSPLVIGDTAAEKANVPVTFETSENWVTFNGSYQAQITVDPDNTNLGGQNYPVSINVLDNTTSGTRTATVTVTNANARVTGLAQHTLTITQTA